MCGVCLCVIVVTKAGREDMGEWGEGRAFLWPASAREGGPGVGTKRRRRGGGGGFKASERGRKEQEGTIQGALSKKKGNEWYLRCFDDNYLETSVCVHYPCPGVFCHHVIVRSSCACVCINTQQFFFRQQTIDRTRMGVALVAPPPHPPCSCLFECDQAALTRGTVQGGGGNRNASLLGLVAMSVCARYLSDDRSWVSHSRFCTRQKSLRVVGYAECELRVLVDFFGIWGCGACMHHTCRS